MRNSLTDLLSTFGRTVPPWFADRIGRFNVMIVMAFFCAIIVLALWLPSKANAPLIVFAALYGFGSGAVFSLAPALIAQISDIRKIGVRTGTLFATLSIVALVGNPIGGAIVSKERGSFLQLQIFCGVLMAAGSVVYVLARVRLSGFSWMAKV